MGIISKLGMGGRSGRQGSMVILAVMIALVGLSSSASAYLSTWYDLPNHNYVDGNAKMTTWRDYDYAAGYVQVQQPSSGCYYIQRRPVADFALDGGWKRSSSNHCAGSGVSYKTFSWSDDFSLAYNGFKFRVCKDIPYQADSCGSAKTIYPYR